MNLLDNQKCFYIGLTEKTINESALKVNESV